MVPLQCYRHGSEVPLDFDRLHTKSITRSLLGIEIDRIVDMYV